jgi:hypothetical protein
MINWNKVSEKVPEFKKIVLGLKLPNQVELVVLDHINEKGLIFYRPNTGLNFSDFFTVNKPIDIDFWAEIDLPKVDNENK